MIVVGPRSTSNLLSQSNFISNNNHTLLSPSSYLDDHRQFTSNRDFLVSPTAAGTPSALHNRSERSLVETMQFNNTTYGGGGGCGIADGVGTLYGEIHQH